MVHFKLEGASWVENIYNKFEEMCTEVDNIMRHNATKDDDDQVESAGELSEAKQDVETDASLNQTIAVLMDKSSNISKKENDISLKSFESSLSTEYLGCTEDYELGVLDEVNYTCEPDLISPVENKSLWESFSSDMFRLDDDYSYAILDEFPHDTSSDNAQFRSMKAVETSDRDITLAHDIEVVTGNLVLNDMPAGGATTSASDGFDSYGILNELPRDTSSDNPPFQSMKVVETINSDITLAHDIEVVRGNAVLNGKPADVATTSASDGSDSYEILDGFPHDTSSDNPQFQSMKVVETIERDITLARDIEVVMGNAVLNETLADVATTSVSDGSYLLLPSESPSSLYCGNEVRDTFDTYEIDSRENDSTESTTDSMESIELCKVEELEDSTDAVDNKMLYAVSRKVDKLRSYKKKIRDSFYSKRKLAREYEMLAIWFGDVDLECNQDMLPSSNNLNLKNTEPDYGGEEDPEWELL